MDFLILRLEGPLLSFGGPIVDQYGKIQPYPSLSMITGLLANALGLHHGDVEQIQSLQDRIRFGSREDRAGSMLRDFQTVDLSKPYMSDKIAWTTRGKIQTRAGASGKGTHIRLRDYWADSCHTVVVTLVPSDGPPTLQEVAERLEYPERPLFIGRKTCIPSSKIYSGVISARSVKEALERTPALDGSDAGATTLRAWWPADPNDDDFPFQRREVTDQRDWANQIHVGSRTIIESRIELKPS